MNKDMFWFMLSNENKEKAEEICKGYNGSDGVKGRIFELYCEAAKCVDMTLEQYREEVGPNLYVESLYDVAV